MANTMNFIRIAQAVGIASAGVSAGTTLAISHLSIPAFFEAPSAVAVRQWDMLYERGKALGPKISLVSMTAFAYLAYSAPTSALARAYLTAGACVIGIIPYTLIFLAPTNDKLKAKVGAARKLGKGENLTEVGMPDGESSTTELLAKWRALNYGRGVLPLVGMGVALWTVLP